MTAYGGPDDHWEWSHRNFVLQWK